MVATISFARQLMDGKEGSWKGEEVLYSGVWKIGNQYLIDRKSNLSSRVGSNQRWGKEKRDQ